MTFDASSSTGYDEPLSYIWDFGDGSSGGGVSPTHAYMMNRDYLITLDVTDADGSTNSTSLTITVEAHKELSVNLSGEHDYLFMERIKIRVAALVTDKETMEPVSGANVTIEIYDPEGDLWISDNMTERFPGKGIYEWKSTETIRELMLGRQLGKGVYLVLVQASFKEGPTASDILEFHIDPQLEGSTSSLTPLVYYAIPIIVLIVGTMAGITLFRRHRRLQVAPK